MTDIVNLRGITKSYDGKRFVLKGVNLNLARGSMAAIIGPSGAGKSTLLNILGLLDIWNSGEYIFNGTDMKTLNDSQRSAFRNRHLGFVFQDYCLLPNATVEDNILLPVLYSGESLNGRIYARIDELTETFEIVRLRKQKAALLSGGERQRTAIARALVLSPELLIADEPTGNLDGENAAIVMRELKKCRALGCAVAVVTHDMRAADVSDVRYLLQEGVLMRLDQTVV